jgi:hypothetical protein
MPARHLPHGLKTIDLDPLGDERRELLGLGLGEVEMILAVVIPAGDADREPAVTSGEAQIALRELLEWALVSFAMGDPSQLTV